MAGLTVLPGTGGTRVRRRRPALLLVALAAAISAAQVLVGLSFMHRFSPGSTQAWNWLWIWPALTAVPLVIFRPALFRIACMVLAAGPVVLLALAAAAESRLGGSGVATLSAIPDFPGSAVVLMLAAVSSYGSRKQAENTALLGIVLAFVIMLAVVSQVLLLGGA